MLKCASTDHVLSSWVPIVTGPLPPPAPLLHNYLVPPPPDYPCFVPPATP